MKKTIFSFSWIPVVFLLVRCGSASQTAAEEVKMNEIIGYEYDTDEKSLLWEITGNGLKQPSYLYGTIHIQRKEVFAYDTVVSKIFDTCAAYAMELNMDEIDMKKMNKTMQMDKPLDSIISAEKYRVMDSLMLAEAGMGMTMFKKMKPFFLMAMMMKDDIGTDMPMALDLDFFNKAKKKKKKLIGIEKFEEQMAAVDELTIEEQVDMILEGMKDTTHGAFKFDEMLDTYLAGDLEKMVELTKDSTYPEKFHKAFLHDRNIRMADRIAKICSEQMTFNAVGAGHLGGDDGVIALLRKKGFTLKPIKTEFKTVETK
ncbi:MAG: TraB/GumN family protein [Bacteroidota bacterium]